MNLDDLLKEMKEKMQSRDLSDKYLEENGKMTRTEMGIGEYGYGITTVPCEWVYDFLSDYKKILKENEILKEEKEQAWEEWNNLEQGSYGTEQKLKQQIKELRKENEELNNRCRNLDKEAQAYLEELAGDNTLTRRTIKQLQEENEELKKDYYNVINKIENKIDILDIAISECIYIDDDDKAYKKAVKKDKLCLLNQKRALQELLEGRE